MMYNGKQSQREMLWKTSAILDMKGDVVGKTGRERILKTTEYTLTRVLQRLRSSFISAKPKMVKSKIY